MGFIIAGTGDFVSQRYFDYPSRKKKLLEERELEGKIDQVADDILPFEWDARRTFQMSFIRAVVITPFVVVWYPFIAALSPGKSIFSVLGRIIIDQAAGGPLVISLVFTTNAILNNQLSTLRKQIIEQFTITWVSGLKYWPFVHIITFGVLPLMYQPLFAHFASVYWNALLSYYANLETENIKRGKKNLNSPANDISKGI
jgi:protein Mpv17